MVAKSIAIVTIMEGTREADGVRRRRKRHTLLLTLDLSLPWMCVLSHFFRLSFASFTKEEEAMMSFQLTFVSFAF